jgi:hypothetical protein
MIRIFLFECEECGYTVKVAGGLTEGRDLAAQTILCEECNELRDAVIARRVPTTGEETAPAKVAPPFEAVANLLPPMGSTHWVHFEPACSNGPHHPIRLWHQPGKCPHCGVFMERNTVPFRQWE